MKIKEVDIYSGIIGKTGDVVLVENRVPAIPEIIAEKANVSLKVAKEALEKLQKGDDTYTLAGWWNHDIGELVLVEEIEGGEVIDIDRNRNIVVIDNKDRVWEPFYILLSETTKTKGD